MPGDGDALRHRLGGARRRPARGPRHRPRLDEPDVAGVRRAGRPLRRRVRRRPASGRTARSGSTSTTPTSTWRRSSAASRRGRCRSTSTTATWTTSCAYLLDNADAEALVFHTSLGDRVARVLAAFRGSGCWWRSTTAGRRTAPPSKARCRTRTSLAAHGPWSASPAARTTSTCSTPAAPPACPRASCTPWAGMTASFVEAGFPLLQLTPAGGRVADRAARHRAPRPRASA